MRVLITGASGYVAKFVAENLARDHELVLFSRRTESRAAYHALFAERRIEKRYEAIAPPLPGLEFPYVHRSRLVPAEPFFRRREAPGTPNSTTVLPLRKSCILTSTTPSAVFSLSVAAGILSPIVIVTGFLLGSCLVSAL